MRTILAVLVLAAVCSGITADLNNDGVVDFQDFSIMADQWLEKGAKMTDLSTRPRRPAANYVGESVYVNYMDDHTGWTTSNSSVIYEDVYSTRGKSVKATATGTGTSPFVSFDIDPSDLTGCHGVLRVFVPEGDGNTAYTLIGQMQVWLEDGTGKHRKQRLWRPASNYGVRGWTDLNWVLSEFDTESTGFDISNVTKLWILFPTTVSTATPSVVFDGLEFYRPSNPKGLVMLRMDGQYDNQQEACDYALARGLRVNVCVGVDDVGGSGKLSLAQLQGLRDDGHFVMIYSYGWHFEPIPDTATKISQLEAWQTWMTDNGFAAGRRYFAHSSASFWNYNDRNQITPDYLDGVMGGVENYGYNEVRTAWNPRFMPWTQFATHGNAYDPDFIARGVSEKGILTFGYHGNQAGELDAFKTLIDLLEIEINSGNLIPVTFDEFIRGKTNDGKILTSAPAAGGSVGRLSERQF